MACFDFSSSTVQKSISPFVVCCHTTKTSYRRNFHSELRPPRCSTSSLLKRKSHSLHFTHPRPRWSRIYPSVFAEYNQMRFNVEDYRRVKIDTVAILSNNPASGTLLLIEDKYGEKQADPDPKGMMIHVGGDTLAGIALAVDEKMPARPMSLQLLNSVLERLKELSPGDWSLLHVAVVDIRDNTFIGRLYFGDPATGDVFWDCDCRPSDACWLSIVHQCRIYIRHSVWESCAESLQSSYSRDPNMRASLEKMTLDPPQKTQKSSPEVDPFTSVMDSDPMIIKLLKREMSVAVTEEDYSTAAQIRDHPYMKLYKSMVNLRKAGRYEEASKIEKDLLEQISQEDNEE